MPLQCRQTCQRRKILRGDAHPHFTQQPPVCDTEESRIMAHSAEHIKQSCKDGIAVQDGRSKDQDIER